MSSRRTGLSLTAKLVRDASPGAKTEIIWDAMSAGLGLRVTATGVKAFVLSYRHNGRKRLMTLGRTSELSLNEARNLHSVHMQTLRSGSDPMAEIETRRNQPTIGDVLDQFTSDYLDSKSTNLRGPTIKLYRTCIEKQIRPSLGKLKTNAITKNDVRKMHRAIGKETPYFANRVLATVSRILSLAVEDELLDRNPAIGIERFPEENRERYASQEEMIRLTTALADAENQDVANVIRLMMVTGCRKGEAMAAQWSQFETEQGFWVKDAHSTKQKRKHRTPLNTHARDLFQRLRNNRDSDKGFIFPAPTKTGHIDVSHKQWKAIRDDAGLDDFRLHDLRHSFASILVSEGFSLEQIGKLLGHTNASTTQRYAHVNDTIQQQATEKVAAILPRNVVEFKKDGTK